MEIPATPHAKEGITIMTTAKNDIADTIATTIAGENRIPVTTGDRVGIILNACPKCRGSRIISIVDNHIEAACLMCGKLDFYG